MEAILTMIIDKMVISNPVPALNKKEVILFTGNFEQTGKLFFNSFIGFYIVLIDSRFLDNLFSFFNEVFTKSIPYV